MTPDETHIPLKRPHMVLRDNQLFFLASRRPHLTLTAAGTALWNRIDGRQSAGDLEHALPGSLQLLSSWWHHEAIDMAEPVFPKNRIKILVVEPHMDDAILSIGALMWERRHTHEFTVVSMIGVSNFTSYQKIGRDYFDTNTISELRGNESALAMRLLGGRHRTLDLADAPLRYQPDHWSADWFNRNRRSIAAFINLPPCDDGIRAAVEQLTGLFTNTRADGIWIPMGVGTSTDHETTRNGCLIALGRTAMARNLPPVTMYQDVPYALDFPWHTERIISALRAAGANPRPQRYNVTNSMHAKLRLVSVYASQFKMNHMGPRVEKTARMASPEKSGFSELTAEISSMPDADEITKLNSGRKSIQSTASRLSKWGAKHRGTDRLTVICPPGVGLWKKFAISLMENFPTADVHIHLSADAVDETRRFVSPRVHVHPVEPYAAAWVRRICRLIRSGAVPMVVITGWRYHRWTSIINATRLPFVPLATITAGHLVNALNDQPETPKIAPDHQS